MTERLDAPDATIPVLAAVITRGDRYLVCQRPTHKRHGGLWEFPGGKLEPGETPLAGAQRELGEELGVQVTGVGRQLFATRDPGSAFVIEFHETSIAGEPHCLEHQALAWLTVAQLAGVSLAPSDAAFVRFLAQERSLGR